MNRSTVIRILEAFFRYKYLYLVPLVLAVLFGVYSATNQVQEYTSSGAVFVERGSFVTQQTGLTDGAGTYLSPAQYASQDLNGLLQTDQFVDDVLTLANVESDPAVLRGDQIAAARGAIAAYPASESLMIVRVTTTDPEVASEVARATVDQFQQFKIALDVEQSNTSTEFFEGSLAEAEAELSAAQRELREWLDVEVTGGETIDDLGAEQAFDYQQRVDAVNEARDRRDSIEQSIAAAELLRRQAETDVMQKIYLVDEPTVATQPISGLTGQIVTVAAFTVLGLFVMIAGPVLGAVLDRSVVFRNELIAIAGPAVVAVVPHTKGRESRIAGAPVPEPEPLVTGPTRAPHGDFGPPVMGRSPDRNGSAVDGFDRDTTDTDPTAERGKEHTDG